MSSVHRPQASRDPLSPEVMSEIFEDVKDMGVLIGKGGIYGQVTILCSVVALLSIDCQAVEDEIISTRS